MIPNGAWRLPLGALLLCLVMARPAAADGFQPLRDAVARYPEDRDLAWALARSLADAGNADAIETLEVVVARWSDHTDAHLRLGALLSAEGRDREALTHFDVAVAQDPRSGPARMLRGVSLDRLGRHREADEDLVLAATLDPALRSESMLLRAVSLIERGEEEAGFQLLEEVIELDPLGDVADAARVLLAQRRPEPTPRLRLQAYAGMDYDSNATLDSGSTPALDSDKNDGAGVWGAMVAGDVLSTSRHRLSLGARYHERDYLTLHDLDQRSFVGFASGRLAFGRDTAGQISGLGSYVMLHDDSYLWQAKVEPELLVWLGPSAGVLKLGASVAGDWYEDDPPFTSLERDAVTFGGGLAHLFPIPGWDDAQASWGFDYERVVTDASRDALGFKGDYDRNVYAGHVSAQLPLPLRVTASLNVALAGEIYDNDNLADYLAQLQAGDDAKRRRRKDLVLWTGVVLSRPIVEYVDVELQWSFQDRFSNTDLYRYHRHVVGAMFRVKTF